MNDLPNNAERLEGTTLRLVDADKLEEKLRFMNDDMSQACVSEFDIADAPTVEAAPVVHGHWEFRCQGSYNRTKAYCTACCKASGIGGIRSNQMKPFCPNCGAKMGIE